LLEKIRHLPRTLCHYDFDNRNLGLRETPEGAQTVVIDWEIVGEGLSSADVGRFLAYQQPSNVEELVGYYLDELERNLGRPIDREAWLYGSELVTVALWQIVGVLFGVMVSAPSAPVPDDQRDAMKERVYSDIAHVESLVRKHGLA
jgi:thiamine kinase-like enzyme